MQKNGEGGIRTPGTGISPYNGLANRRFKPLSHLSTLRRLKRCSRLHSKNRLADAQSFGKWAPVSAILDLVLPNRHREICAADAVLHEPGTQEDCDRPAVTCLRWRISVFVTRRGGDQTVRRARRSHQRTAQKANAVSCTKRIGAMLRGSICLKSAIEPTVSAQGSASHA